MSTHTDVYMGTGMCVKAVRSTEAVCECVYFIWTEILKPMNCVVLCAQKKELFEREVEEKNDARNHSNKASSQYTIPAQQSLEREGKANELK